ncbi:hypothetical protein AA0Z99_07300 [Agrococcus sp. 1P02AA]
MSERRHAGIGRVLIAVYAVLAIAATGRSFVQIVQRFDEAPLAYALSAAAAVVYLVATVALAMQRSRAARAVALAAVCFELVGVLVVGTLSIVAPSLFGHDSVWSYFGMGYVFIPAVLPFLGLWWLHASRERVAA